jgi:hypothetical protein
MKRFNIAREKFIRSRLLVSEVICEADGRAEDDYLRSRWAGGRMVICEADGRAGRIAGGGCGRAMVREVGDPWFLSGEKREVRTRSYQPEPPSNYPQIPPPIHSIPIPQQST